MSQKNNTGSGGVGTAILVFVLALVILFVSSAVIRFLFGLAQTDDPATFFISSQSDPGVQADLSIYGGCIFSLVSILIFGFWYRRRFILPYRHLQPTTPRGFSVLTILTLLLLAFGAQFLSQMITSGLGNLLPDMAAGFNRISQNLFTESTFPVLAWIYAIFLGPVAEEFIFRGLIYRFARLKMPFLGANILQAVLFGIYHMNLIQGIYAFVIGMIFGFIASRGRGIRYSIVLHILFNLIAVLGKDFIPGISALMPGIILLASIALVIFTMFAFAYEFIPVKRREPHQPENYPAEEQRYRR